MTSLRRLTFIVFCLLPALVFTSACSSRGNKKSVDTTSNTGADTSGGDLFGGGTTNSSNSSNSSSTIPNLNNQNSGNLFDTDLDDSERPSGSQWSNYGQVSPQQQACLANGFNSYGQQFDDEYYGVSHTASSTSANSCVSPGQSGASGYMSRDSLLTMGIGTYGNMSYCLDLVLSYQPTANDAALAHRAGAMALTRCYMGIVSQLQQSVSWGQPQQQVFVTQNQNLRVLLLLLATDR